MTLWLLGAPTCQLLAPAAAGTRCAGCRRRCSCGPRRVLSAPSRRAGSWPPTLKEVCCCAPFVCALRSTALLEHQHCWAVRLPLLGRLPNHPCAGRALVSSLQHAALPLSGVVAAAPHSCTVFALQPEGQTMSRPWLSEETIQAALPSHKPHLVPQRHVLLPPQAASLVSLPAECNFHPSLVVWSCGSPPPGTP